MKMPTEPSGGMPRCAVLRYTVAAFANAWRFGETLSDRRGSVHDDWEDEARWEAEQEAAAEARFEKQAREWVRDNAAEFAREFFEENYDEAVKVFTSERLQSFYVGHPELAFPALDALNYARSLMPKHPRAALVFGVTSAELVIKNVLLKPLISGLVHAEDLASLVVEQSTNQTGIDRFQKLLAGIVSAFSPFDLSTFKRVNTTQTLWQEIRTVQEIRNAVIHRGEPAEKKWRHEVLKLPTCC
jgi:hypothetical protein